MASGILLYSGELMLLSMIPVSALSVTVMDMQDPVLQIKSTGRCSTLY